MYIKCFESIHNLITNILTKRIPVLLILLSLFSGLRGRSLDEIKRSGKIYVALSSTDIKNINYDLAREFARYLNVELKVVPYEWDQVFMRNGNIPDDLEGNAELIYTPDIFKKADLVCSTFTVIEWRRRLFGFAETLLSAELLLIHKDTEIPGGFEELSGKRVALLGSSTFEQHMREINSTLDEPIKLQITGSSEESKRLLEEGRVYGIVLDADEALNFSAVSGQKYKIALPVSDISRTAWACEKNNPLIQEIGNFFEAISGNGVLDELFRNRFGITYKSYLDQLNRNLELDRQHRTLDEILASGKLVVALRERDFVYHESGQKQFMHALAEEFADYLGVSLEFIVTPGFERYWETRDGVIVKDSSYTPEWFQYFDLACETMAPLDWRKGMVNMIPVYPSAYTIVANRALEIESLADLEDLRGVTGVGTVYEEILKDYGISNYYYENINNFIPDVLSGKADYTILYNAFSELSIYPELEAKLDMDSVEICWALRKDQPELQREVEAFIRQSQEHGLIGLLIQSLRGHTLQAPEAIINSYYESFQTGQLPHVDYGADEGLPQEDIFSIFQDQKGYMWFGTNSGAVRYNGRQMIQYNHEKGMPGNTVRDIEQDSAGTMYFATTGGIAQLRGDTISKVLFAGTSFHSIFVDSRNNHWFLGDRGICLEGHQGDTLDINEEQFSLPGIIYDIKEDPDSDRFLLATINGIYVFDPRKEESRRLSLRACFSMYVDVNDSLWISTRDGLLITHLPGLISDPASASFHNLNRRLDFPVSLVSDIFSNRLGSLWLLTDSRIIQIISTDHKPVIYEQETGIHNNKILSFMIDHEDNIWIGFSGGLQRLTNTKGLRNFYPDFIDSYIYSVFEDRQERIWITSDNGTHYFHGGELVDFNSRLGSGNRRFVGTLMPNEHILLANKQGLYELNGSTLEIERHHSITQIAHSIENIFVSSRGEIFLLTGVNGIIYYFAGFSSPARELKNEYTTHISQLIEMNHEVIGGSNVGFVRFNGQEFELLQESGCGIWSLYQEDEALWVGTDCGIGLVKEGRFDQMELTTFDREIMIKSMLPARNRKHLWLGTNKGFSYFNTESRKFEFTINTKDGLSGDEITPGGLMLDHNHLLWVGTYHGISNFNIKARSTRNTAPVCYIERLYLNGEVAEAEKGRIFAHNENNLVFEISALSYADEASLEYEYYLRGKGNTYASYHRGSEYRAVYNNLPPGNYEFIYKAKGKNNIWGYAEKFDFSVSEAWYRTWVFRILLLSFFISSTYFIYLIRIRAIKAQKDRLELQVWERTREINEQKDEIEAQRNRIQWQLEEIENQRDHIKEQRDLVMKQKQAMTDSITYAQKIQSAILPLPTAIKESFSDYFIIFQPRDIVSGDFYWFKETKDSIIIVGADCTGHGVPGAFMSMLGVTLLNEELRANRRYKPSEMLGLLRAKVKETLTQDNCMEEQKDGMEMAFVLIDKDKRRLQYAGANQPLYLIREKDGHKPKESVEHFSIENNDYRLYQFKGDRQPIGTYWEETAFTNHEIELKEGDTFYIFSDGILDQYGGNKRKKYKAVNFRKLLLSIQQKSMQEQKNIIQSTFDSWRGRYEQIDDVSVIGVRI